MKDAPHPTLLFITAAMFAWPFVSVAQDSPARNPGTGEQPSVQATGAADRVAYVNIQNVMADCMEGKGESEDWKQWLEKRRSEMQVLQKELDALKNKLDVQSDKLTEEARYDLVDTIDEKDTRLQRTQQDVQKEMDKRQRRLTNTIYKKILPVIRGIAEKKNLDAVYFVDVNRDAYIKPSLLITEEVIEAYDATYPYEGGKRSAR